MTALEQALALTGGAFDAAQYAENNPDVVANFGASDAEIMAYHYVTYGQKEGRSYAAPKTSLQLALEATGGAFDWQQYLANNPDVAANFGRYDSDIAAYHWLTYGRNEGRSY